VSIGCQVELRPRFGRELAGSRNQFHQQERKYA